MTNQIQSAWHNSTIFDTNILATTVHDTSCENRLVTLCKPPQTHKLDYYNDCPIPSRAQSITYMYSIVQNKSLSRVVVHVHKMYSPNQSHTLTCTCTCTMYMYMYVTVAEKTRPVPQNYVTKHDTQ